MILGGDPCYPPNQLYTEIVDPNSDNGSRVSETQLSSFLCSLSILKEKVNQVQSCVNNYLPQEQFSSNHGSTSSVEFASIGSLIQEIIVTASSMMFSCQQMTVVSPQGGNNNNHNHHEMASTSSHMQGLENNAQAFFDGEGLYNWYTDSIPCTTTTTAGTSNDNRAITTTTTENNAISNKTQTKTSEKSLQSQEAYDIVEIDAADLLAKYTHYCQVCGKGFKRDANLRMHMRAHGDEYKSSAALSNPLKKINAESSSIKMPRKYSCPHEGCRWNKKHAKFQPLKSVICVKNHYKRSHCPKMYVCKRCNRKQFSVLSDLRTHEKHCGDLKWQCSCGTTFSRKDKLMGHVALFIGHSPLISPLGSFGNKVDNQLGVQIQFRDS